MSAPAPAPVRTDRDPAVVIRVVAGACWFLTAGLVLAGAPGSCHDGVATDGATNRLPASGATAFAAWLVMIGAMMLPTVVPLVRLFVPVTARVPHRVAARLACVGGYLAVWSGFAAVVTLGLGGVDALVRGHPPGRSADLVLGSTLAVAGLFQFSRLKHACLTACRSPWGFLWQHYRRGVRGGWTLGVRHGLMCLGCCWALMLVMVGAGVSSLLWMLALTGFMIVEKTAAYGPRLVAPLGGALVLAGFAVVALSLSTGPAPSAGPGRPDRDGVPGEVALLVAAIGLAVLWPTATRHRARLEASPRRDDDPRGVR